LGKEVCEHNKIGTKSKNRDNFVLMDSPYSLTNSIPTILRQITSIDKEELSAP
jgi:hypothetical protein